MVPDNGSFSLFTPIRFFFDDCYESVISNFDLYDIAEQLGSFIPRQFCQQLGSLWPCYRTSLPGITSVFSSSTLCPATSYIFTRWLIFGLLVYSCHELQHTFLEFCFCYITSLLGFCCLAVSELIFDKILYRSLKFLTCFSFDIPWFVLEGLVSLEGSSNDKRNENCES